MLANNLAKDYGRALGSENGNGLFNIELQPCLPGVCAKKYGKRYEPEKYL